MTNIKDVIARVYSSSALMGMLPERPGYNGSILMIDDDDAARVAKDLDDAAEALDQLTSGDACKGKNCGSKIPSLHSAECFAEHEKTIGVKP